AGAVLPGRVARRRDATPVRVPIAERVLGARADAEDLLHAGSVGTDHVAIAVLEIREVLVRDIADPRAVVRPQASEYGERVARERRVIGPVRAHLPDVQLSRAVGGLRKPLVRVHGEPPVVGTELDRVLLRGGVVRELHDLPGFDLDLVQVVLLVATGVLAERDEAVVAAPREAGAHRARDLAMAHLPHVLGRKVHDVELDAPGLIPVETHLVAPPRDLRKEERGQATELLERYARLSVGDNGHYSVLPSYLPSTLNTRVGAHSLLGLAFSARVLLVGAAAIRSA